nr:hypothetical protein GCM10020063_055100 [Dactylosporangium thailandense]
MTTPLEGRYERLLRVYPAAFRRAHGEDMLTTMLADAGDGQRWPRPGDAADIVLHGLRLRLSRRSGGGLLGGGWADACALIGPLAVVALLTFRLTSVLRGPHPGSAPLLQTAAWALVAVAAFAGLRRGAAALGWVALLAEVAPPVRQFTSDPVPVVYGLWWSVLALVAAVALTAAGPRRPWAVAGTRRFAVLVAAPLVVGAVGVLGSGMLVAGDAGFSAFYLEDMFRPETYVTSYTGLEAPNAAELDLMLLAVAVALLAGLVAAVRLPGPIRRRLLVAAAPVLTMAALVNFTFNGWAVSTVHMGHNIPLVTGQWAALVLLPLLAFLLGAQWARRRDETMRLAALGAAAERERP